MFLKLIKKRVLILLMVIVFSGAMLWLWCRAMKIVAVHQDDSVRIKSN